MNNNLSIRILDLMDKKEPFTQEEKEVVRKYLRRDKFVIKYGIYTKNSNKNCYISFIIDSNRNQQRRTLAYNNFKIICQREISDLEFEEQVENFGCNPRILEVFYYRDIETLIKEDLKYNINTPEKFVKECKSLGYTKN